MHIKTVIIQGFKAFHERTVIDSLSPAVNLVIGHNGAGKSTFIDALQFVLTDRYANLSQDDRLSIFSRSSNITSLSQNAVVEIHLDNSQGELVLNDLQSDQRQSQSQSQSNRTQSNTVIIRRKLTRDKDEYTVNNVVLSRTDLANLLQPFGLGNNNHSFAEQNSIQRLLTVGDYGRLELLMQAAGTVQYDQKRAESVKIMNKTDIELKDVDLLLSTLNLRLVELQKERKKLISYEYLLCRKRECDIEVYKRTIDSLDNELHHLRLEQRTLTTTKASKKDHKRSSKKNVGSKGSGGSDGVKSGQNGQKGKTRKGTSTINAVIDSDSSEYNSSGSDSESESDLSDLDDDSGDGDDMVIEVEQIRTMIATRRTLQSKLANITDSQIGETHLSDAYQAQLVTLRNNIVSIDQELGVGREDVDVIQNEITETHALIASITALIDQTQIDYDNLLEQTSSLEVELQLYQERRLILKQHEDKEGQNDQNGQNGGKNLSKKTKSGDHDHSELESTLLPQLKQEFEMYKREYDQKMVMLEEEEAQLESIQTVVTKTNVQKLTEIDLSIAEHQTGLATSRKNLEKVRKTKDGAQNQLKLLSQSASALDQQRSIALNQLLQSQNLSAYINNAAEAARDGGNKNGGSRIGYSDGILEVEALIMRYNLWRQLKDDAIQRHEAWVMENRDRGEQQNGGKNNLHLDPNYNPVTGQYLLDGVDDLDWASGVYGPLFSLISWSPMLDLAMTATFGPRLYYILVDSPSTAMKLHRSLSLGSVTVIPVSALKGYEPVHYSQRNYQGQKVVVGHVPQSVHQVERIQHKDIVPILNEIRVRSNGLLVEYPDEVNNNANNWDIATLDEAQAKQNAKTQKKSNKTSKSPHGMGDSDNSDDEDSSSNNKTKGKSKSDVEGDGAGTGQGNDAMGGLSASKFLLLSRKTDVKYYHIKFALRHMINNYVVVRSYSIGIQINAMYPAISCVAMASGTVVGKLGEISGGFYKPTSIIKSDTVSHYMTSRGNYTDKMIELYQVGQVTRLFEGSFETLTAQIERNEEELAKFQLEKRLVESDSISKHYDTHRIEATIATIKKDTNQLLSKINLAKCKLQLYGFQYDLDNNHSANGTKGAQGAHKKSKNATIPDSSVGSDDPTLKSLQRIVISLLSYNSSSQLDSKLEQLRKKKAEMSGLLGQYVMVISENRENLNWNLLRRLTSLTESLSEQETHISDLDTSLRSAQIEYSDVKNQIKAGEQKVVWLSQQFGSITQQLTQIDLHLTSVGIDPSIFTQADFIDGQDQDDDEDGRNGKNKKNAKNNKNNKNNKKGQDATKQQNIPVNIDSILNSLAALNNGVTTVAALRAQQRSSGQVGLLGLSVIGQNKAKMTAISMKLQNLLLQRSEITQSMQIMIIEQSNSILYQLLDGVEIDLEEVAEQFGIELDLDFVADSDSDIDSDGDDNDDGNDSDDDENNQSTKKKNAKTAKSTKKQSKKKSNIMGDKDSDDDSDSDVVLDDSDDDVSQNRRKSTKSSKSSKSKKATTTTPKSKSKSKPSQSKILSHNPALNKVYGQITRRNARNPSHITYCLALISDPALHPLFSVTDLSTLDLSTLQQLSNHLITQTNHYNKHTNRDGALIYLTLRDQFVALSRRRSELTSARRHLIVLILALDKRKKEAIETTFEKLNTNFKAILGQLWSTIQGELVLQQYSAIPPEQHKQDPTRSTTVHFGPNGEIIDGRDDDEVGVELSEEQNTRKAKSQQAPVQFDFNQRLSTLSDAEIAAIINQGDSTNRARHQQQISCGFSGIGVVITNPTNGQKLRLASMSGGQGSQISIALLLAIQHIVGNALCSVFDEPDANMDSEFTQNLLSVLYQHAHGLDRDDIVSDGTGRHKKRTTQTILTSFHTDLATKKANVIYQVSLEMGHPRVIRIVGQASSVSSSGLQDSDHKQGRKQNHRVFDTSVANSALGLDTSRQSTTTATTTTATTASTTKQINDQRRQSKGSSTKKKQKFVLDDDDDFEASDSWSHFNSDSERSDGF